MKSDSIYNVIHAMDGGEIRYCREALKSETGAAAEQRLCLFDALLGLSIYSNDNLYKALKGRTILNNLAVEKTRLFGRLLKYISLLQESKRPSNDANKRFAEAKVLVHLGMQQEALEVTTKGLSSALRVEDLQAEVLLRDLLRQIYKGLKTKNLSQEETTNEYLLETASRKLARLMRYKVINDRAFDYLKRYRVSDEVGAKNGMEELINLPEMKDINMADSLPSQIRYYQTLNYYLSSKNEMNEAIEALTKCLELWESNSELIATNPNQYLVTLSNMLGKLNLTGRMSDAPTFLKKMEQVPVSGRREQMEKFLNVELQYQLYYLNSGMLVRVVAREAQTLGVLHKFGKTVQSSKALTLLFNLAVAHLLCGNSGKSLANFNRIRDYGILPQRQDIQGVSRLIRLLLLAESDTAGTFPNYLRNSKRYFKTEHKSYILEKVVLKWLAPHYKLTEQKARQKSFEELSTGLSKFVKSGMMGAEEIQIWAFANANQLPLMAVFQQNLHKAS